MTRSKGVIVQSERLRDQIYKLIRDDLRTGALAPGERLVEVSLAKKLGVSRTPVREALFQLASDGLLAESSRGYMLPVHTTEEIRDRLEIRRLLEPEILRRACEEASSRQIKSLLKALEEEKKYIDAADASKFIGANADFRLVLLSLCKNPLLTRCAELYDDQFQCFRIWGLNEPRGRELAVGSHEKICNAIKDRKPAAAVKALQQLLDRVEQMLEQYRDSVAS